MADKRISNHIVETCKKLGIDYTSCNPNYTQFYNDALRLRSIYRKLKVYAGELEDICERHKINGLNKLLRGDIEKLEKIEHDLIKMATKISEDKK